MQVAGLKVVCVLSDASIAGKRTIRGGALCSVLGGVAEDEAGGVGYVLAHVRNCSHLSREQETSEAEEGSGRVVRFDATGGKVDGTAGKGEKFQVREGCLALAVTAEHVKHRGTA